MGFIIFCGKLAIGALGAAVFTALFATAGLLLMRRADPPEEAGDDI